MDFHPELYITKGNKKSIAKIILGKIRINIRPSEHPCFKEFPTAIGPIKEFESEKIIQLQS